MQNLMNQLQFYISVAKQETLDKNWNSNYFSPNFRCIPFSRLYLPCSGKGFIIYEGKTFTLKRGSMFLISPLARVQLSCPHSLSKYWCHFNASVAEFGNDIFSMLTGVHEIKITEEQYSFFEKLFQQIISSLYGDSNKKYSSTHLETLYANSALTLLTAPFLDLIPQRNVSPGDVDRIYKMIQYMNANLASSITLKELAEVVGLHPNYVSTIFLRCMGMSPFFFLSGLRLSYAWTELQRGKLRIGEIAEKIGFKDISSFSKFFKSRTGMSPRAWREKYNQQMTGDNT